MIEQILKVALGCSIAAMVGCEIYTGRLETELVRLIQGGSAGPRRKRLSKREISGFESISAHPLFRRAAASSRLSNNLTDGHLKHLRSDPEYADLRDRYSRVAAINALSLLAFIAIIFGLVMVHENSK